MGRKKVYPNAAARQKAFRIRHGQKRKVSIEISRGERLGSQETDLRAKKEEETWEQYQVYINKAVEAARRRQASEVVPQIDNKGDSKGAKRSVGGYKEPSIGEEYYETREQYEAQIKKIGERR